MHRCSVEKTRTKRREQKNVAFVNMNGERWCGRKIQLCKRTDTSSVDTTNDNHLPFSSSTPALTSFRQQTTNLLHLIPGTLSKLMHRPRHRHSNSFIFQLITTTTALFPSGSRRSGISASSCCFVPSTFSHHLHHRHHLSVANCRRLSYRLAPQAPRSFPHNQRHPLTSLNASSTTTMMMSSTISFSSLLSSATSVPTATSGVMSWIKSQVVSYWYIPVGLYVAIEVLFMVVFYTYMIPRANELTEPGPYRDYPQIKDRTNLMLRIMHRIEKACRHQTKQDEETLVMKRFLTEWFHIERRKSQQQQQPQQRKTIHTKVQSDDDTIRPTATRTAATATVAVQAFQATATENATTTPGLDLSPSSSPENSDVDDDDSEGDIQTTNRVMMLPTRGEVHDTISTNGLVREHDDNDDDDDDDNVVLYRQDMDEFFSWAFFGKFHDKLSEEESEELDRIYNEIEKQHPDLTFPPKPPHLQQTSDDEDTTTSAAAAAAASGVVCKARRMTLEPMRAMYRPLSVYLGVGCLKIAAGLVLRYHGFQRIMTESGLVGWYRPASTSAVNKDDIESSRLPLLFFHGIAPGGFALYLPLLLKGFATETDRPVFLFENKSISCAIDFHPLTEEQTVDGVIECLEKCGMGNTDISLMGHSFGSCTIAWLVAAALSSSKSSSSPRRRKRQFTNSIKQIVLIDPVAILLSEPDVMVNFLYSNEIDKIKIAASSELFTEWYLRRNFSWYNSELHLDDVSKLNRADDDMNSKDDGDSSSSVIGGGCEVLVALSEKDEIINATKVRQEIERHGDVVSDLIYWTNVGHGAAVPSPSRWKEVKDKMLSQEERIFQQSQSIRRGGEGKVNENKKSK